MCVVQFISSLSEYCTVVVIFNYNTTTKLMYSNVKLLWMAITLWSYLVLIEMISRSYLTYWERILNRKLMGSSFKGLSIKLAFHIWKMVNITHVCIQYLTRYYANFNANGNGYKARFFIPSHDMRLTEQRYISTPPVDLVH